MENKEIKDNSRNVLVKKILTIVGNVLFYAVIIVLFLFSLMNINAGNSKDGFPNIFGIGMLSVQTNSMERNEGGYEQPQWKADNYAIQEIKVGDLVNVKVFNESDFDSLKVGDVITFVDEKNLSGMDSYLNTHRIVYKGADYVICQGDRVVTEAGNNKYAFDIDNPFSEHNGKLDTENLIQSVAIKDIRGIVTGVVSGGGYILSNIRQNWLFYFVIPVAVVLVLELFFVFKNILDLRNEKAKAAVADDKEAMMAELELEKERMRQELLAELKAQQAAENNDEPKVEETVVEETIEEAPVEEPVVEETVEEVVEETVESENETEEKTEE